MSKDHLDFKIMNAYMKFWSDNYNYLNNDLQSVAKTK